MANCCIIPSSRIPHVEVHNVTARQLCNKRSRPQEIDLKNKIISSSISTYMMPSEWKRAKVTPIYKSGDRSDPNSYHPISVLRLIPKIMEHAIQFQLVAFLTKTVPWQYINQDSGRNIPLKLLLYTLLTTS